MLHNEEFQAPIAIELIMYNFPETRNFLVKLCTMNETAK